MNACENDACYANISEIINYFKCKPQSGFLFCSCNNQAYVKQLNQQIIQRAKALGLDIAEVYISYEDRDKFPDKIRETAESQPRKPNGVIVNNLDELIYRSDGKFLREINFSREILIEIGLAVLFGNIGQVKGGDLKHFPGALAIRPGYDGRMNIEKTLFMEKFMHTVGKFGPNPIQCPVLVGARTQVCDGPQKLVRMPFLL